MNDITELFGHYLSQYGSIDIAESEFKNNIHEDKDLHDAYREWCHMVGSSEKNGFKDYCEEVIRSQDDVWQTLNDNDDDNF